MIRKPGTTLVLTLIVCCCATVLLAEDPDTTRELVCGPFIGHVEATHVRVWARFRVPGTCCLVFWDRFLVLAVFDRAASTRPAAAQ